MWGPYIYFFSYAFNEKLIILNFKQTLHFIYLFVYVAKKVLSKTRLESKMVNFLVTFLRYRIMNLISIHKASNIITDWGVVGSNTVTVAFSEPLNKPFSNVLVITAYNIKMHLAGRRSVQLELQCDNIRVILMIN